MKNTTLLGFSNTHSVRKRQEMYKKRIVIALSAAVVLSAPILAYSNVKGSHVPVMTETNATATYTITPDGMQVITQTGQLLGKPGGATNPPGHDIPSTIMPSNNSMMGREGGSEPTNTDKKVTQAESNTALKEKSCNPVILATGEKIKLENDIITNGRYGLGIQRTYRSQVTNGLMFGGRWHSTYDYPALGTSGCSKSVDYPNVCLPTTVTFTQPDGTIYSYTGTYVSGYTVRGNAAMGKMTYDREIGFTIATDDKIYFYSKAGVIQSVSTLGREQLLRFSYVSGWNRPASVSNAAGHYLNFSYNSKGTVSQVTDQDGRVWSYQYDGNGMLTSAISPGANPDTRTYFYENSAIDPGLLTGIAFNGVRYSTYSYYADKRVHESALAGDEVHDTFTYNGSSSTVLTDAYGQVTTYNFLPAPVGTGRNMVSSTRAGTATCVAAAASTGYDANGYVAYQLDWNGNKDVYTYDASGRLLNVTYASGTSAATTQVNTWANANLINVIYKDAAGTAYLSNTYEYVNSGFGLGNLSSFTVQDLQTGGQHRTTYAYAYYSTGVLASLAITKALPEGPSTTTSNYDAAGNLTNVINPMGHTVNYSGYNGLGFASHITDANGSSTDVLYDEKSNVIAVTDYINGVPRMNTYQYNGNHQLTQANYADGHIDRFTFTASGRLAGKGDAQNNYVLTTVDIANKTVRQSAPRQTPSAGTVPSAVAAGEFSSTTILDSQQRPYSVRGNNGQDIEYRYDKNGNLVTSTDAAGHVNKVDYDALDRPVQTTAADGGVTKTTYNSTGQIMTVTDPRGLVTSYTYNGFGNRLSVTSPDTGRTVYAYDAAGRLQTATFNDGHVITYGWDMLGRMVSRQSNGVMESMSYDEGQYGRGQLTRMNDATGETRYDYNSIGAIVRQTNNIYGQVYYTSWNYDVVGRLVGMTYPTGLVLHYSYDQYGRRSAVTTPSAINLR
jgi:YD repeat-containing protein